VKKLSVFVIFVLVLALSVPAFAADRAIANGIDLWRTPGDGNSYADFSQQPIPAGFFCPGSAPFTGRIITKGIPIASNQPGALGNADTIVQRLDNAKFNKRGVATTRIQMRAMQFEGLTPIKTSCGVFKAFIQLDGEQPVTRMQIVRDSEKGGRFSAPISVNVKFLFKPVDGVTTEVRELRQEVRFPPARFQRWSGSRELSGAPVVNGSVKVDTDGDGTPDTLLPGTSNFLAGRSSFVKMPDNPCHWTTTGRHCPVCPDCIEP
jgi:hypothetical protein